MLGVYTKLRMRFYILAIYCSILRNGRRDRLTAVQIWAILIYCRFREIIMERALNARSIHQIAPALPDFGNLLQPSPQRTEGRTDGRPDLGNLNLLQILSDYYGESIEC